jgi:hypothetical protein
VGELGMIMDRGCHLPVHRIRAAAAGQVQRDGAEPAVSQFWEQVPVLKAARSGGVHAYDGWARPDLVIEGQRAIDPDVVTSDVLKPVVHGRSLSATLM